jgi:4-hydroxybenzoate polyprenyltransferase
MFKKVRRLFVIKTPVEAYLIIYALALGAVERGSNYLVQYPGFGGKLLFLACTGAVFMAGGKILDCLKHEKRIEDHPETVF